LQGDFIVSTNLINQYLTNGVCALVGVGQPPPTGVSSVDA
jgi:hypothetical protein